MLKFKSADGNILIIVILITLCCIFILSTTIYTIFNQLRFSIGYKDMSNISYLSIAGAEKLVSDLNSVLYENIDFIIENLTDDTSSEQTIELQENIDSQISSLIKSKFGLSHKFYYTANIENYEYKTEAEFNQIQLNKYQVYSTTKNLTTGSSYKISGIIDFYNQLNLENLNKENKANNIEFINFRLTNVKYIDNN